MIAVRLEMTVEQEMVGFQRQQETIGGMMIELQREMIGDPETTAAVIEAQEMATEIVKDKARLTGI